MEKSTLKNLNITVLGLGYVGLPLALELSRYFKVSGFDTNKQRINELNKRIDSTNEVSKNIYFKKSNILFTNNFLDCKSSNIFIITVPTPVNKSNEPDLKNLKGAAELVAKILNKGDIIIIESTVYPGVTEEIICPILEIKSGLTRNLDFNIAYSPERINPGDTKYKISNIKKVVAADNKKTLNIVSNIYKKIIKAGIYKASSIKVAETSKAIENAQRDINIAFVNEVVMICKALNINSSQVLEAASTKWNFLNFKPGLVGGHCIGVDPFYLAKAAKKAGHNPEIILAGRKINDYMPEFIFKNATKKIKKKSRVLLMGLTFKENVKDIRNSKSAVLEKLFRNNGYSVDVYDPVADKKQSMSEYKINLVMPKKKYDCIILTVGHNEFSKMSSDKIINLFANPGLLIDIKNIWKIKKLPNFINRWSL
ncbi:nucleotide sugar dehydrogenase [Alphaproteobacteria bacterium]|nr:nucleotide sugar dehydrogenase [Alphaproteobacteria bacterium]